MTLTRKSQVLDVLHAGGRIEPGWRGNLLVLHDKDGQHVDAWQQALSSAQQEFAPEGDTGKVPS